MIRLTAVAFVTALASSVQAMPPVSHPQPNDMVITVREGCGPGQVRVAGVCAARTEIRQDRRAVRRCLRWNAGVCALWGD